MATAVSNSLEEPLIAPSNQVDGAPSNQVDGPPPALPSKEKTKSSKIDDMDDMKPQPMTWGELLHFLSKPKNWGVTFQVVLTSLCLFIYVVSSVNKAIAHADPLVLFTGMRQVCMMTLVALVVTSYTAFLAKQLEECVAKFKENILRLDKHKTKLKENLGRLQKQAEDMKEEIDMLAKVKDQMTKFSAEQGSTFGDIVSKATEEIDYLVDHINEDKIQMFNALADGLAMADGDDGLNQEEYNKLVGIIKRKVPNFQPEEFSNMTNEEGVVDYEAVAQLSDNVRAVMATNEQTNNVLTNATNAQR